MYQGRFPFSLFMHPLPVFLVPNDRCMNFHAMHLVRVDPDSIKIVKLLIEEASTITSAHKKLV